MRLLAMPMYPDTMLMRSPAILMHPPALKTLRLLCKTVLSKLSWLSPLGSKEIQAKIL